MDNLFPGKTFSFKGITLTTGDIVAFVSKSLPIPEMQAAFTDVDEEGDINVFSTLLAPFQHNGKFSSDDIAEICVIKSGKDAIFSESRNSALEYGQTAKVDVPGEGVLKGVILAAFDGIVALWSDEIKNFLLAGSAYVTPTV